MRRTVHISGKIEPLFGTLDENVRLLEDALQVRTHLNDTRLTIEGKQDSVDQAIKIIEEYNHLTRHGRELSSAEVKSLMRVATEEPHESPRAMFEHGRARSFGKKVVTPKNASQRRYMEEIEKHFLPGTLQQKIDPYMRPLYDALYDMLDADKLDRFLEKGIIEVAPLAREEVGAGGGARSLRQNRRHRRGAV